MHGTDHDIALGTRPIDAFIAALDAAMELSMAERPRAAAAALSPLLARTDLLDGCDCTPRADRYARRLIHADPGGRFSVLSLVWSPGQASPIHAHNVWCAFGVHCGTIDENYFDRPAGGATPGLRTRLVRMPGECAHGPASPDLIHQIANRSDALAVSIHVYGVGLDRVDTGVNRIYA